MSKKMYLRKFLNKKEGMAAIEVECDADSRHGSVHIDISITDCSRKVTLEMGTPYKQNPKDVLYKYDVLLDSIKKAREFYVKHSGLEDNVE